MFRRVYLDNSATTQVDERVLEAMLPYMMAVYGNASSIHFFGQQARTAVDKARHQVAASINSRPNEVIFTSGGTESNNLAIRGLAEANIGHGRHIITSAIEHPAVKNTCEDLEERGFEVTYLPVYENGIVRIDDVAAAVREDTILVSIMTANNEIGTIQPVVEIGKHLRDLKRGGRKIWFHTDAVQALGKISIDVEAIDCDLLTVSGHKINGPKGIGALYVRRGVRLHSQNMGGRQERGIRGGTEPVQNIVGLGEAAELAAGERTNTISEIKTLRDDLEDRILRTVDSVYVNGDRDLRLPNISNVSFQGVEGEALVISLDMNGIAASTGAACSSGSLEPSPVIRALGTDESRARGAIRFSLGINNSKEDVDRLLDVLPTAINTLRMLAPK